MFTKPSLINATTPTLRRKRNYFYSPFKEYVYTIYLSEGFNSPGVFLSRFISSVYCCRKINMSSPIFFRKLLFSGLRGVFLSANNFRSSRRFWLKFYIKMYPVTTYHSQSNGCLRSPGAEKRFSEVGVKTIYLGHNT